MDNSIQAHQKELCNKLWAMANALRGNMEAYEFKNYILGISNTSPVASSSARERVLFCKKENTELNLWLHHGSSKPGKRSFGRFSRPLLEVYFLTEQ